MMLCWTLNLDLYKCTVFVPWPDDVGPYVQCPRSWCLPFLPKPPQIFAWLVVYWHTDYCTPFWMCFVNTGLVVMSHCFWLVVCPDTSSGSLFCIAPWKSTETRLTLCIKQASVCDYRPSVLFICEDALISLSSESRSVFRRTIKDTSVHMKACLCRKQGQNANANK